MDHTGNHLIESFPRHLQQRFLERCERFVLEPLVELVAVGVVLSHAYFPGSAVIALSIDANGRESLELGAVGRESMLGSELLLGAVGSPWRAIVGTAGTCWRIEADRLRQAMADMPELHATLRHNFLVQIHQRQAVAVANAVVRQRPST